MAKTPDKEEAKNCSRDCNVGCLVHDFPDCNISTSTGWITMKFDTDIHGPQKINPIDFGDPLTFHLVQTTGQTFDLSSKISQHLIDRLAQTFMVPR